MKRTRCVCKTGCDWRQAHGSCPVEEPLGFWGRLAGTPLTALVAICAALAVLRQYVPLVKEFLP